MAKSADAFRTISEVADWLETPAHVLRFWESKFSQVKPVKRAGGRRYYRPADMKLLGGIKKLLHDDGMTIKGVQKMLREQGVSHVSDFSQPLGDAADDVIIDHVDDAVSSIPVTPTSDEVGQTTQNRQTLAEQALTRPAPTTLPSEEGAALESSVPQSPKATLQNRDAELGPESQSPGAMPDPAPRTPNAAPEPPPVGSSLPPRPEPEPRDAPLPSTELPGDETEDPLLNVSRKISERLPEDVSDDRQEDDYSPPLPSFLQRRGSPSDTSDAAGDENSVESQTQPETASRPRPLAVDVPDDPEDDVASDTGVLTLLSKVQYPIAPVTISSLESLLSRLRATTGSATRD